MFRRKRGLRPEQQRLLALMRDDSAAAAATFSPNAYWREVGGQFERWFHDVGIGRVEKQAYNALFSTPAGAAGRYFDYAIWMLYSHVRAKDTYDVLGRMMEAELPRTVEKVGDHLVNWDLLVSIDSLYSLAELDERIWSDAVVVADLGSGWGRIGYVLQTVNPESVYVALDLPHSLLIASATLPKLLPESRIWGYTEARSVESFGRETLLGRGGGVWLCGAHHLARFELGSIDCFFNAATFQELNRPQVTEYLRIVDRTARTAYFQEYWTRPPGLSPPIVGGLEEYDFPERWERRFQRPVVFSQDYFEAGFSIPPRT